MAKYIVSVEITVEAENGNKACKIIIDDLISNMDYEDFEIEGWYEHNEEEDEK